MFRRPRRIAVLFLFGIALESVWAHEGHDHSGEANLQILKAGPNELFQVSVARLPDAPVAGQTVKFLVRLEQEGSSDDPLLAGRVPVVPRTLQVSVSEMSQPSRPLKVEEAGEAGVYRFEYPFPEGGPWNLLVQFEDAQGTEGKVDLVVPVKAAPGRWTVPLLQGLIVAGCLGLVVRRFFVASPRAALASSLVIVLAGGAAFLLVGSAWPSAVPEAAGDLGIEALAPPPEQLPELAATPEDIARPASAGELLPEESPVLTGTVRYASNRVVEVQSPFPGVVVYKNGVPAVGDSVRAGQVLAVIQAKFNVHDAVHLLNARWELLKPLLRAREEKVQTETSYDRDKRLAELGAIPQRQLQASEYRLKAAETAVKEAEERLALHDSQIQESNLRETQIVSPIKGYITRAVYASGQMIYGGDVVFEIIDPSVVWVEAHAFPRYMQRVQQHPRVKMRSTAFPDRVFSGRLVQVRVDTDPESKAVRVFYEVNNPDSWLKAGMLLSVEIESNGAAKAQAGNRSAPPPPMGGIS
ncbi:MAG: efflux RND transporter periplasmic adaptor subunit [Acidobacteria bacterium]|nr:efflux RND transporter periplasmic adaptor subunit [Acidobacteriota bacterium]